MAEDSIAVFAICGGLFFTDTRNFDTISTISINKSLNLYKREYHLNRIIWFDGNKCLFVTSLGHEGKDIIAMAERKTGKVTKLLEYSLPQIKSTVAKTTKPQINIIKEDNYANLFLYRNYPNGFMYSVDDGKLFIFYYKNQLATIDTYSLPK